MKGHSIGRDDIAALEVVADRRASFTHKLNVDRIDIHWLLDLKSQKPPKAPRPSTPVRNAPSSLDDVSPVQPEGPGDVSAVAGTAATDDPQLTGRSIASSATTTASVRRGRKLFEFRAPPLEMMTISTLDRTQIVIPSGPAGDNGPCLINSPRSAFVLLKNGFSLPDVCGVSLQDYYNKALLDGVTLETVKMRVAAEEERREKKFEGLQKVYATLCTNVSRDEVVEAVRTHRYAEDLHREEDAARLKEIPHYAHPGKLDLTILDADCVDVLHKSRTRTLQEIRRTLDQRDRLLKQSIERETAVMAKEKAAQLETLKVQEEYCKNRDAKASEQKRRRREVVLRVEKLLASQVELTELRRQALMEQGEVQEQRVKEKKDLERCASLAMIDERERRRKQVREDQQRILEERREELVVKQELQGRMKEREEQLKRQARHVKNVEKGKISQKRRETIRQLAAESAMRRMSQQNKMEQDAEVRTKEFSRRRELRQQVKKERAAQRAERTGLIREQGERIKAHRMEEMEREYEEKLKGIVQAQQDKEERILLSKEMAAQIQLEKIEEKERTANADEFSKIAYVSTSNAKERWMNRANEKRATLASQVRQEREAMTRAKLQVFEEMETMEIQRKKHASSEMLMVYESTAETLEARRRTNASPTPSRARTQSV